MKVTLKKLQTDGKKLLQKAPLIITIAGKPKFILLPYESYMFNRTQNDSPLIEPHKPQQQEQTRKQSLTLKSAKKPKSRLYKLLFE